MQVTTDVEGFDRLFQVGLQLGFSSAPSTGFLRVITLMGSGLYSGNLSMVLLYPNFGGLEGLNAKSWVING